MATRISSGVIVLTVALALAGCSGGGLGDSSTCGWDLGTSAGRQASSERLTFASQWLAEHPGEPVPAPTSTYWRGECPTSGSVPPPPVDEGDQPEG